MDTPSSSLVRTIGELHLREKNGAPLRFDLHFSGQVPFTGVFHLVNKGDYGRMDLFFYAGRQLQVWYNRYQITRPVCFTGQSAKGMLELQFFRGTSAMSYHSNGKVISKRPGQLHFYYQPYTDTEVAFGAGQTVATVDIHLSEQWLLALLPDHGGMEKLLTGYSNGSPVQLYDMVPQLASVEMDSILNDLSEALVCNQLLLEEEWLSLVAELLLAAVDAADNRRPTFISTRELDACVAARQLVAASGERVYTLPQVSAVVGMNTARFHQCFTAVMGTSFSVYSRQLRLARSKTLLSATDMPIQDIAQRSGYTEHANFSAAFRRAFGLTPDQWRKKFKNS